MAETLSPDKITAPISPKTVEDINDIFKEDANEEVDKTPKEERKPEVRKTKESEKEGEEDKESDTGDIELVDTETEEGDEEALDLTKPEEDDHIEILTAPRKKDILKKYPEFFKEYPFMEKMLYRDKQYTELFGSFDDAKELAEKAEVFSQFESQLLEGNTVEILKNVKETDSKAFDKIVDDYLPMLAKVDKDAYFEVIGNLNKRLIMEMVKEANESENDKLKEAAMILNNFLFGTAKFSAPTTRSSAKTEDEAKSKVEEERLAFVTERFETARDELQVKVDNVLRSTISQYIDPKNQMTAYIKRNAINDALGYLNVSLARDENLKSNLNKLWRNAFDSKFSKDSLTKIQSHYLGRAKASLKNAIMKARSEALKDTTPRERNTERETEREETPQRRGHISGGRVSQPTKSERQQGESVQSFFARD